MNGLMERTAVAPFRLNGKPVRKGQVVTIDRAQLKKLVDAGCVLEDPDDNAAVPKADIPVLQRQDVEQAGAEAAEKIAAIRATVDEAQKEADSAIGEHAARVEKAAVEADQAIEAHQGRVKEAETSAETAIAELEAKIGEAKDSADKAESPSKSKAK